MSAKTGRPPVRFIELDGTDGDTMNSNTATSLTGIHLMAKPIGPLCNLDCFYLEKEAMYPPRERASHPSP